MKNSYDMGTKVTRIKSGYVAGWQPNTWHHLKMAFRGSTLSVLIDGTPVMANYVDSGEPHTHGMVALGTEWIKVQFDNFCVGAACP